MDYLAHATALAQKLEQMANELARTAKPGVPIDRESPLHKQIESTIKEITSTMETYGKEAEKEFQATMAQLQAQHDAMVKEEEAKLQAEAKVAARRKLIYENLITNAQFPDEKHLAFEFSKEHLPPEDKVQKALARLNALAMPPDQARHVGAVGQPPFNKGPAPRRP